MWRRFQPLLAAFSRWLVEGSFSRTPATHCGVKRHSLTTKIARLLRGSAGGAIPAPPALVLTPPTPRQPAAGLPCYLNWGMTLSVRSRRVFITTSRGTDAVQLTSNLIFPFDAFIQC